MKSIAYTLFTLLMLTATPVLADPPEDRAPSDQEFAFSGTWEGVGFLSDINDRGLPCEKIRFQFEQTKESLTLLEGIYKCSGVNFEWKQVQIEIQSQQLVLGGEVLGEITENSFSLDLGAVIPDMVWTLKGERREDSLILLEVQSTDRFEIHSRAELESVE